MIPKRSARRIFFSVSETGAVSPERELTDVPLLLFESSPSFLRAFASELTADGEVMVESSTRSGLARGGTVSFRVLPGLSWRGLVAVARFSVLAAISRVKMIMESSRAVGLEGVGEEYGVI